MRPSLWSAISTIGFLEDMPEAGHTAPTLVDPASWLPRELMIEVLSRLDLESLIVAGQVCRSWRALAKVRSLWKEVELHDTLDVLNYGGDYVLIEGAGTNEEFGEAMDNFLRQVPRVRTFFRTLVAAPFLRRLVLGHCVIRERLLATVLQAPISEVHTLEFSNFPDCDLNRKVLKKFSKELEVLKIKNLTSKCVPIINRMKKLKVLHFSNSKGTADVPLFPRLKLGQHSTLAELRPLSIRTKGGSAGTGKGNKECMNRCHVFQSTVRSLVEAHAATLEALHLPERVNSRMILALGKCHRLESLTVPLQPGLADVCVPSVRRLTVLLGSKDATTPLALLPPTIEELTLLVCRRSCRLGRELKLVGAACSRLASLRRLRVTCVTSEASINVAHLTSCLLDGLQREDRQPVEVTLKHASSK